MGFWEGRDCPPQKAGLRAAVSYFEQTGMGNSRMLTWNRD